ncbi:MAG: hypothetical protein IT329_23140 [Caldilineaceae bacterium]|nr:hypothetical protein [Caldilineaceae bacterium]
MLAGAMDKFHYLRPALAVVLVFVGVKMVMVDVYKLPVAAGGGLAQHHHGHFGRGYSGFSMAEPA